MTTEQPAVIYARQSFTRDGSESLAIQVDACRRWAERFDREVVAELVEPPSTSGYRQRGRNRPRFRDLLDIIGSGEAKAVVAYTTDRLSRGGGPGWAPLLDAFERARVGLDRAVLVVGSGWIGEFELSIRAAMDREESKKLSTRMIDVREREAREGRPITRSFSGFGYTADMRAVPREARAIRAAVRDRLAGATWRSIAKDWNDQGVMRREGGPWFGLKVRQTLTASRLAGLVSLHGEVVATAPWRPIITVAEFEQLVAIHERARVRLPKNAPEFFPLRWFGCCAVCGRMLDAQVNKGDQFVYSCKHPDHPAGVPRPAILAHAVEAAAGDRACAALAQPTARLRARWAMEVTPVRVRMADRLRELAQLSVELRDLYRARRISSGRYGGREAAIGKERAHLLRGVELWRATPPLGAIPATETALRRLWDRGGSATQRAMLAATVDHILVGPCVRPGGHGTDLSRVDWHLVEDIAR